MTRLLALLFLLSGCTLGVQLCSRDSDCGWPVAGCAAEGVCVENLPDAGVDAGREPADAGRDAGTPHGGHGPGDMH
jgi:hypothetical protein